MTHDPYRDLARINTFSLLGRELLGAGDDVVQIFEALVSALTATLCDGCAVELAPINQQTIAAHRLRGDIPHPAGTVRAAGFGARAFASSAHASAALPAGFGPYIERFGLRGIAVLPLRSADHQLGVLVAMRDRGSAPFDDADLAAIATCIDYASSAAERALQLATERARSNVERARTAQFGQQLLGVVAHDLRSPLAAIIMGTERLLDQQTRDGKATHTTDQIGTFARRMTRMIDQVLDMTRLCLGGGLLLDRCSVHLHRLVSSVLEEVGRANPTHHFELGADTGIVGHWDPARLGQVIAGLLRNAAQYGRPDGSIVIGIEPAGSFAQLTVRNELRGRPIPTDEMTRCFEPYQRGWEDDAVGSGLGLDLYIAREIVLQHGGTLDADSTGSGTTFRLHLPILITRDQVSDEGPAPSASCILR